MVASSRRGCCYEGKIVEIDGAIRLRPQAHFARLRERLVIHIEDLLAVDVNAEKRTLECDPQGTPNPGRNSVGDSISVGRFADGRQRNPLAFLDLVKHAVVFQRVAPGDVIRIRILVAPYYAGALVNLPGNRLEGDAHFSILQVGIVIDQEWKPVVVRRL